MGDAINARQPHTRKYIHINSREQSPIAPQSTEHRTNSPKKCQLQGYLTHHTPVAEFTNCRAAIMKAGVLLHCTSPNCSFITVIPLNFIATFLGSGDLFRFFFINFIQTNEHYLMQVGAYICICVCGGMVYNTY